MKKISDEKALDCKDAIIELKDQQAELYVTAFNNIVTQYEDFLSTIDFNKNMINEFINQQETAGYLVSSKYYEALMAQEISNMSQLQAEKEALLDSLNDAVANGNIKEGSEDWYDMCQQIDDVTLALEQSETTLLEYEATMRELDWSNFDALEEKISSITTEADFLINLLSGEDLYDDTGQLTDEGMATMGLHAVNYDTYLAQAQDYANEIAELDKEIAKDPYNQDLVDRREELLEQQQEMIEASQDEKQAIIDMVEEGIELELSALQEKIDAYEEELQAQKDLYDYNKKVKSQTEEIASLEKQIAAYSNDDSQESKAKVQELKTQLAEAESDLEDMQMEQAIQDQNDLLDDLYTQYEDILNERLDDVDALISDMIKEVNENSSTINKTLEDAASSAGYTLSDSMETIWGDSNASDAVTSVVTGVGNENTTLGQAVLAIKDYFVKAEESSDENADSDVNNLTTPGTTDSSGVDDSSASLSDDDDDDSGSDKQGNDKINIGDKVTFDNGVYYTDATGAKEAGKKRLGKEVYITDKIKAADRKSNEKYWIHISKGSTLGDGDLGWVKKSQLKGYASGVRSADEDEWAWTQEEGAEIIRRASDGAVFTPIGKGGTVFNAEASQNLWDVSNNPAKFIQDNMEDMIKGGLSTANAAMSTLQASIGDVSFEITLPNVTNYDDFKYALQHDKNFENMVKSMTVDKLFGGSSLKKYKY